MEQPLISVVIPVYKVEKYLDRCLQSVTGQTYRNLEILLVDDGSPDASGAICDRWAQADPRIRVIHQQNAGGGAARNAALDVAKGEIFAFVDSDDYMSADMFSCLYGLMDSQTDIAECGYVETDGDDAEFGCLKESGVPFTPQEAMAAHIADTQFRQLIWNKLYRRCVVEDVRFPVGTGIDDEFFTYRALGNARRLIRVECALYAYRQQADSIMHRPYSLKRLNGIRAKLDRLTYLEKRMPELVTAAKQELLFSCLYGMQGSLEGLDGTDLEAAKRFLYDTVRCLGPVSTEGLSCKKKLLMKAIRKELEKTARILNFLIRIHVLS